MPRENQVYEDYWSITFAYTNIYGEKFHTSLKLILDFIDQNNITLDNYNDDLYNQLQQRLNSVYEMNELSIRKIINQYVKLGFVNYKLAGYHPDARKFLISSSN